MHTTTRAAIALLLITALFTPIAAGEEQQPPAQKVTVTDFSTSAESTHSSVRDAVKAMAANLPCSRAVAVSPVSGQQVRIIRTGVRWASHPKDAVFLLLGTKEPPGPDLVFAGQRQYIQYLVRHPDAARQKPKPLRVVEAVKEITREPKAESPRETRPSTPAKTP